MEPAPIPFHGTLLAMFDKGVLLTGAPGSGKSELALGLVDRGHRLVADDAPLFSCHEGIVTGICPPTIHGRLAIRGIGILDLLALYGPEALQPQQRLDLILKIAPPDSEQRRDPEYQLGDRTRSQVIGDCTIPVLTLPAEPGRNLPLLAETRVRAYCRMLDSPDATA